MTTTILLIRHGQTDWNQERRWQGHVDRPLNQIGREQAELLARRLQNWPITAVYSSDLTRAAGTAAVLARTLGLEPIYKQAWRERHVGLFEGLTKEEIAVQLPQSWARLQEGIVEPPDGERMRDLHERVVPAFQELLEVHAGEVVAVVSHGGTLRAVIAHVLSLPVDLDPPIRLNGNTGITIVEAAPNRSPVLSRLNDTGHLEDFAFAPGGEIIE